MWIALRANLRKVLETVTVADVAAGRLPKEVVALTRDEEAWGPAGGSRAGRVAVGEPSVNGCVL